MEDSKRYSHIDLMETIAIFFVITYHSTLYSFDITRIDSALYYFRYFGRTILSTCVPLFFFVNGYLLFNKQFDLKKHIRKIIKLIILVFVWALILMPAYLAISGEPLDIKVILDSISSLSIPWSMNIFWFVGALVCLYFLFPVLKVTFDKDKRIFKFFIIVCAIFTFGTVLANQLLTIEGIVLHQKYTGLNFPVFLMFNPFREIRGYSFVYFCLGGMIYTYEDRILSVPKMKRNVISASGILLSCSLLFLIGILYSKYNDGEMWDVVWNGYDSVFTLFNVLFIYVLCLNYKGCNKLIISISKNTLGIYFLHKLIVRLTQPWIKTVPALCNNAFNLLYAFSIMCICLLICILMKKIPVLKKLI